MKKASIGVLLTNIGTPKHCNPEAVQVFLKQFLSDPRVVNLSRLIWLPILYGLILPIRSKQTAKLYQSIWREDGSPLLSFSKKMVDKLQKSVPFPIEIGMQYSEPSIESALNQLLTKKVNKLIILPLYPQYASATTLSTFDRVFYYLQQRMVIPKIGFINSYAEDAAYIAAIAQTIQQAMENSKATHLLFSFHGIPAKMVQAGDIYPEQCLQTAILIAERLQLKKSEWTLSFQSRVGFAAWQKPYTDEVLKDLPQKGILNLAVVCPGFAVDCLETLEEIAIRGKDQFLKAGGQSFQYIPCLNDTDMHINLLHHIIQKNI